MPATVLGVPFPPAGGKGTPAKRLSLRLWADINPELVY